MDYEISNRQKQTSSMYFILIPNSYAIINVIWRMSRKFRCWRYLLTPSTHSFVTDELLYKNNSKFLYIVIPGFFRALRVFLVAFVTISANSKTVYHNYFTFSLVSSLLIVLHIPSGLSFFNSSGNKVSGQF